MIRDIVYGVGEFVHDNAGKLLVLSVFLILLVFAHHSAGNAAEAEFSKFCMSKSGEAFAAFLGLITGAAVARVGNGNGNGTPPKTPSVQLSQEKTS